MQDGFNLMDHEHIDDIFNQSAKSDLEEVAKENINNDNLQSKLIGI